MSVKAKFVKGSTDLTLVSDVCMLDLETGHLIADTCEPIWHQQHAIQHREPERHAQEDQSSGQTRGRGVLGAAGIVTHSASFLLISC